MPEADESYMSGMIAKQFSNGLHDDDHEVLDLWADASIAESDRSSKGSNFESFLETLVEWIIKHKQNSAHDGTAIMAI